MKSLRVLVILLALLVVVLPLSFPRTVAGDVTYVPPTEAPTGFDNLTNGLVDQATHNTDRGVFKASENAAGGLGPTFNGNSCDSCHFGPVTGGVSTVTELRAGHLDANGDFVEATAYVNHGLEPIPNRSLINLKATCPNAEEQLLPIDNVRALRITTNLLGAGFVEAISDATIEDIRLQQIASGLDGKHPTVAAFEGGSGFGRFGWKNQHVSLLSFSSDAYLNEMGISNRLSPDRHDFTHQCEDTVAFPDQIDPEDIPAQDIDTFTQFIRATKAPPRDTTLAATAAAKRGETSFRDIGCATCHWATIVTAPVGSPMFNGDPVPPALGNKTIHPYSDFMLHNIGTGDGIVQGGAAQSTRNRVRTAPLWGLRTHQVFLHDGSAATLEDAIQSHAGQALGVTAAFNNLTSTEQQDLIQFLMSL